MTVSSTQRKREYKLFFYLFINFNNYPRTIGELNKNSKYFSLTGLTNKKINM